MPELPPAGEQARLVRDVEDALADAAHRQHPLHELLARLYEDWKQQRRRVERLSHISDSYQALARDEHATLSDRYRKQLRQLGKLARISDRYQSMMRDLNVALEEASTHDPLTKLGNRRLLLQQLRQESERAERHGTPLHVAVIDIDRFKDINDAHGHDAGDRVLVAVARAINDSIREYDHCGRWGGEEFLLVLPQTSAQSAMEVVERVRRAATASVGADSSLHVTLSAGLARMLPGESVERTVSRADAAMYQAKRSGRDRTMLAGQGDDARDEAPFC